MKRLLATRSTSCLAAAVKFVAIALLGCFVANANAQTPSALRDRAIQQWPAERKIDEARLARQGFRVLEGRQVTLVTDLPASPAVDELPKVVDAAVPLLAERFDVDPRRARKWHVLAMVLADRDKFQAAGLMPEGNEQFPDGLSIGYELWVADQPSEYYRRHLLLHELVHSFMATHLGSCGPGWYMEGMAELLGTHTWDARTGRLVLGAMPADRDEVPMWGRTKLVRDAVSEDRLLPIAAVMRIDNRQALDVESYAWVWALAKFLDAHPRYQERFRLLQDQTLQPDFDQRFAELFERDRSDMESEWRLFASSLEYGHDVEREAIAFPTPAASPRRLDTPARVKVDAACGWQCTGLVVEAGKAYELKASGRFVIGAEPDGPPWPSEPGGITLDYHAGHPLGKLLAAVDERPSAAAPATSAFLRPTPIGLHANLIPEQSGVLYLRLNDSPAGLDDNRGAATVSVRRVP